MVSFQQFKGVDNNLEIDINGQRFTGFTYASVARSMDALCGTFFFSTTVKEDADGLIANGLKMDDKVEIFIDDQKVMTGYIEELSIDAGVNSHELSFGGRDITSDIIDSSMPTFSELSFKNFQDLIQMVLVTAKIDVKVINSLTKQDLDTLNFDAFGGDGKAPDLNMTIFDFFDHFAKQKQVLLLTNENGDLVITREESKVSPGALTCKTNNNNNNIISASVNINTYERFSKVNISSQDTNAVDKNLINQDAFATDSQIRKSKQQRIFYPNKNTDPNALQNMSQWHVNMYKAKGTRYSTVTQGYYAQPVSELLWEINTLVDVEDDLTTVKGQYLIEGFSFTKDVDSGSITRLNIVNKGSYSVKKEIEITKETGFNKSILEELFKKAGI